MKSPRKATKLLVFSDTHVKRSEQLNSVVKEALEESDWVVHCGDYTGLDMVKELRDRFPRFVGVYGNSDPDSIRGLLSRQETFHIAGWRIGAIHPYWGAEPDGIEERLVQDMGHLDLILYGHTHERIERHIGDTLLVNPGPGYPEFMTPGSVAMLSLYEDSIDVEFRLFER